MSQRDKILKHLKAGRTLTNSEAFVLFSCEQPATRVFELKRAGHEIVSTRTRLHSGKHAVVYSLATL